MKKFLLSLLSVVLSCTFAWAQVTETLTTKGFFPKNSSYSEKLTSEGEFLGSTWTTQDFNTNNNGWDNIRCGNKNSASTGSIYNNSAISVAVTKVVANVSVHQSSVSLSTSPKLLVSDNSDFTSPTSITLSSYSTSNNWNGDWAFEIPADAIGVDKFYKLEIPCAKHNNKNGLIGLNSLTFYKDEATITKCATPTFSVANETVLFAEETVTIDCATPGATIMYIINDEINEAPAPVTISFDSEDIYVIEAVASKDGLDDSDTAYLNIEYYTERPKGPAVVTHELIVTNFSSSTSTGYTDRTYTDSDNGFVYAAQCAIDSDNFQFRSSNNNSGLIVTTNNGHYIAKSITIEWASNTTNGRQLNFYGSNSAYTSPSQLYNDDTKGTELGSLKYSSSTSTATIEFNEESKQFPYIGLRSNSSALYISKITIVWELPEDTSGKEDAELAFAESEVWATVGVDTTIDSPALTNAKGVEVVYTSSNEDVATVAADGKVTIVGCGTTEIKAAPADTETYFGSAAYTLTVYNYGINKLADIAAANAASGEKFPIFCPLTVGYVNGKNCYVTDGQGGYILVYANNIENVEEGDVISAGWVAEYTIYNGLPELKIANITALDEEKDEYDVVMVSDPAEAELNQIVLIENVTFEEETLPDTSANFNGVIGNESWQFRNTYKIASVEAGTYCVKAIASIYNTTSQLIPLAYYELPEAPAAADYEDEAIIDLTGKKYVEIVLTHADPDNHTIYHKFAESSTPAVEAQALIAGDDHEPYTESIKVTKAGTLTFYARHNTTGAKSQTVTLQFTGETTGITEVSADAAATEFYDLQGRRVNGNARGILVSKQGKQLRR